MMKELEMIAQAQKEAVECNARIAWKFQKEEQETFGHKAWRKLKGIRQGFRQDPGKKKPLAHS
ncbi:hypothetical protein ACTL32_11475 [Planococcus sp. FY231025]|uniref:hypothetical protein n=1 Tax=Planococcus sp. FY231025 TaxID=3455699 RepID=UPI003F90A667